MFGVDGEPMYLISIVLLAGHNGSCPLSLLQSLIKSLGHITAESGQLDIALITGPP